MIERLRAEIQDPRDLCWFVVCVEQPMDAHRHHPCLKSVDDLVKEEEKEQLREVSTKSGNRKSVTGKNREMVVIDRTVNNGFRASKQDIQQLQLYSTRRRRRRDDYKQKVSTKTE